jgi:hypothetical protein
VLKLFGKALEKQRHFQNPLVKVFDENHLGACLMDSCRRVIHTASARL